MRKQITAPRPERLSRAAGSANLDALAARDVGELVRRARAHDNAGAAAATHALARLHVEELAFRAPLGHVWWARSGAGLVGCSWRMPLRGR